jgi:Xaa-Pro aminopeptidase
MRLVRIELIVVILLLLASARPASAQKDIAFPPEVYAERRARLMETLQTGTVILIGNDQIGVGSAGRQDPNFWYLTGVESPWAAMIITRAGDGSIRESLFLPNRDQFAGAQFPIDDQRFRQAPWNRSTRLHPGPEARSATGVIDVYPVDEFATRLAAVAGAGDLWLLQDHGSPWTPPGLDALRTRRQQLEASILTRLPGRTVRDVAPAIERMRLVKDAFEIAALRRAAEISARSLASAMTYARAGMNDLEVEGYLEYLWKRDGSPRPSFDPIVMSGPSAIALYTIRSERYHPTDRVMRNGELLYIDYGAAEVDMYAADICRTFPVSGRFTPEQRRYYEIVLEAMDAALAEIRPGVMMIDVIRAAAGVFRAHGLEPGEDIARMGPDRVWGIMPSPTYWLAKNGELTNYSGARGTGVRDLGHHVGLEALDSRDYSTPLVPGMVFTVEPKIYIPDAGIAIMIEDMILVTEDGYENLSAAAPKTVEEIERLMATAAHRDARRP